MSPDHSVCDLEWRHAADVPTSEPVSGLSVIVAANVRSVRARHRLRQVDVAARSGMSRTLLATLEGERRRVSLDDALALCRGLGVTLAELLEGADADDIATLGL